MCSSLVSYVKPVLRKRLNVYKTLGRSGDGKRNAFWVWPYSHDTCSYVKVDIQSVLRRLNCLFSFFVLKNHLRHVRLYEMYQFVTSYIKWNYNCCLPPSWIWAFLSMKLKKETLRWPRGQDKITSPCVHVLGFCLRETGRNACPCRSAQQLPSSTRNRKLVHEHTVCVAERFFRKWRGI